MKHQINSFPKVENSDQTHPSPALHSSWLKMLHDHFKTPEMIALKHFLVEEQRVAQVFPPNRLIFNALNSTPLHTVRVVILGQDPYHGPGQAHGLSFSVPHGIYPPPSLQNIFRELMDDIGVPQPSSGDLSEWAKRGVLLLNTALTVRARKANSHRGKGWEGFTDAVMQVVSREQSAVVFILWGRNAQEKRPLIDSRKHLIIESPHPSPYSADRGFFGSRPFSRANQFLQSRGGVIDWRLP